ncbi:sensor histidine kinase [Cohnella herbarum]|uniref:Histidine kinase n=1 Tax=Cohnella herbarum TaxID=2728023 RepID=A0A7Z2VQ12_9BACL|nr:histidine kinase [Cohnella herbarum]QJD87114.1 histidine kinase [Cohnella herbarum]
MKRSDSRNLRAFDGGAEKKDEVGFLTGSFNRMIGRIDELVNSVQRSEIMRKEAEYLMLQAQIKPHFLYNTLETIRMLAHSNGDAPVSELTNNLARFVRYSLSRQNDTATIADELEHIRSYLSVHQTRFGDRMKFEIEAEEGVGSQRCPRFILQPLVENSIEHGISKIRRIGLIRIRCYRAEDRYTVITISDSGPGKMHRN